MDVKIAVLEQLPLFYSRLIVTILEFMVKPLSHPRVTLVKVLCQTLQEETALSRC